MITPAIRGGHEVCTPVAVEGAAARRRDRDPHQGHRGHVFGHLVRQRPGDGGPLQRRSVLRRGLRGLRDRVAGDARRGHRRRPRSSAMRAARTRRRSRSPTATRSRSTGVLGLTRRRGAGEEIARDAAHVRRAARQLDPEPDPDLRAARSRRPRHPHAPVPRPVRDLAERDDPGLPQRGRLRRVPGRRAAQVRDGRGFAVATQDRRPPRHRRRARRRDPRLPGEDPGRRRLPRRHARDAGRRRDRRPHRGRRGHGDAAGRGRSRASASTARCCSRWPRTCRSWPSR